MSIELAQRLKHLEAKLAAVERQIAELQAEPQEVVKNEPPKRGPGRPKKDEQSRSGDRTV